ncbi:hypothetical protein [Ralstonia solanacearum]|uniref:hypothetical protein n=1 Tax=Ralstonia solanacearum TaxID=305 RepID=UPI0001D96D17|nr:hypothetical protein [Ralstonia solanacearum]CBJ34865.1 conserved exported protein of unknown function [Ralstonia solanacearum PSI07]
MERQQLFAIAIVIAAVSAAYSLARDLNDDEGDFPPGRAVLVSGHAAPVAKR